MQRRWQVQPFGPLLRGLSDRWQVHPDDPLYARAARNIDFYGGSPGARGGTQLVTGYGTFVPVAHAGGITVSVNYVGAGTTSGGFQVGDTVSIQNGLNVPFTRTIAGINPSLNTLTLSSDPGALAAGTSITTTRPISGNPAIRGLFPVAFRDGTRLLIAAAGGQWWIIRPDVAPTVITEGYGSFTVATWVSSTVLETSGGIGTESYASGIKVGDFLSLPGEGPAGATLLAQITSIVQNGALTRARLTIGTAASAMVPGITATVRLRAPDASVQEFGVMFANVMHLSSAHLGTTAYPPRKFVQSGGTGVIRRHGLVPPALAPTTTVAAGLLNGTFRFLYKYRNSSTGQESSSSPVSGAVVAVNNDITVRAWQSLDPQVDFIDFYVTAPDGLGADYFFFASAANLGLVGTTTVVASVTNVSTSTRVARVALDTQAPDDTEQFIPWPHANRLIAVVPKTTGTVPGPGFLLPSDQPDLETGFLKGESFPTTNMLFVNHDDGDPYVTVAAFFDSLVVFKRRSTWRITGILPTIAVQPVHYAANQTGVGAIAAKLVVQDKNELLFAHDDGYYLLSRFEQALSGFAAERLSLPMDNAFAHAEITQREQGHACYFRPKRQLRAWADFGSAFVYQFDGAVNGDPMGWALWSFLKRLSASHVGTDVSITASAVMPAVLGVTTDYGTDVPDVVQFLGTDDGHVLVADNGTADFGGQAYPIDYETLAFVPSGRGVPARGRSVDFRYVIAVRPLTLPVPPFIDGLTVSVTTEQLAAPISVGAPIFGITAIPSVWHLFFRETVTPAIPGHAGVQVIAPGQYHRIRFQAFSLGMMWQILGWDYLFQELPPAQQTRAFRQTTQTTLGS